jgi:hypothetical protein
MNYYELILALSEQSQQPDQHPLSDEEEAFIEKLARQIPTLIESEK